MGIFRAKRYWLAVNAVPRKHAGFGVDRQILLAWLESCLHIIMSRIRKKVAKHLLRRNFGTGRMIFRVT